MLLSVIPQIEEELKTEQILVRSYATATLGEMFAESGQRLTSAYENTWNAWLERRNDKTADVRERWIEYCRMIMESHPGLNGELERNTPSLH